MPSNRLRETEMTPRFPIPAVFLLGAVLLPVCRAMADEPAATITESKESLRAAGKYMEVEVSLTRPQLLRLAVDSLGQGRFRPGAEPLAAAGAG